MDRHINVNSRNGAPPQEVYIIQLDPNAQIEGQAIPLHLLENTNMRLQADEDPDGGLILPILQEKQIQPIPMLLIEPLPEPVKLRNQCLKTQANVIIPKVGNNLPTPSSSNKIEMTPFYENQVQNNAAPQPKAEKLTILSTILVKVESQNIDANDAVDMTLAKRDELQTIIKPAHSVDSEKDVDSLNYDVTIEKICPSRQKIKNYVHISDTKAVLRAVAVLPAVLQMRGHGISPRRTLPPRIRFGPVQGIRTAITHAEAKILVSNASAPVFLLSKDEDHVTYIDVSDKDKCNWIGLLPLGEEEDTTSSANIWLYEESNELYALTVTPIGARQPLRLGYSKKYADDHGMQHGPVFDLEAVNSIQWWCMECKRGLPSAALLQRHTDVYHKDTVKSTRTTYRCRYCKRAFGRIFSMRRHMRLHCLKKPKKSLEIVQQPPEPNPVLSANNSVLEDSRIPSDESFQNFSNSLDFSTNLFDTDRMAGLDLTSNSRTDSELNPYSIGFRDDNGLSNDLGFTKLANPPDNVQSSETDKVKPKAKPILENCTYCQQVLVKGNKLKHLKKCPSRLICECGRVYRHKRSLAQHIGKCHTSEQQAANEQPDPKTLEGLPYKCLECNVGFKRRGVLVNHLWRIHKVISTLPVQKKVRHYPCVACPKIYRSATKRDIHVKAHHPGVGKVRGHSIEGGVKSCQPASCTECPRQYTTRAKLLQHMRAHHPLSVNVIISQQAKKQKLTKSKTSLKKDVIKEASEKCNMPGSQPRFKFY